MKNEYIIDLVIYKLREMTEIAKMIDVEKLPNNELYKLLGYTKAIGEVNDFINENLNSSDGGTI